MDLELWHLMVGGATVLSSVWAIVVVPQAKHNREMAEFRIRAETQLKSICKSIDNLDSDMKEHAHKFDEVYKLLSRLGK